MQYFQLSYEDLQPVLERAREIAEQGRELPAVSAEHEAYLEAAEELGLPREAILQALRERLLIPGETFAVGQIVFAPSVDGRWYPATLTVLDEHTVTVRFTSGADHTCTIADLRPLALLPGRRLEAHSKGWGWWDAFIEWYDPEEGTVRVVYDDWMDSRETLPLHRIRLPQKRRRPHARQERAAALTLAGTAGGVGLAVGALLGQLLPHLLSFLR